ncbi:hypothetical protein B0H15DRAFT_790285, partial [Mycena belliarum]
TAGCATGAFYTSPTLAQSYDSSSPLSITWKPELSCLLPAPSLVDIYMYAPGKTNAFMHKWLGVPYATGNYSVALLPRWWNASSSVSLQVMVVAANTPPFLSTIPAGPVFTATYVANSSTVAPAADTSVSGSDTTTVTATQLSGLTKHKLSKGATAAAVLLPLIFVLLLIFAYLKVSRARGAARRSEWSEKLDKRMSTISTDWKSVTAAGAKEAIRHSMAVRDSVAFSFSHGATNTSSNVDADPVVMGEKPPRVSAEDLPRTSLGSGVGVGVGARRPRTQATPPERTSRAVSFADAAHPRPSMTNSVYSRQSRAFHTASTYGDFVEGDAPPVPALPSPSRAQEGGDAMTSPRQTAGPLTLTPDDIRRRMTLGQGQQNGGEWRQSVDEVFGALSMMRTGNSPSTPDAAEDDGGEYLFAPVQETVFSYPGTPVAGATGFGGASPAAPASPFSMPMSKPTMSPDEMLRAYATNHTGPSAPSSGRSSPAPATKPLSVLSRAITRKSSKQHFVSPLSNSTTGAEVVSTISGSGMRVLYAQPETGEADASARTSASSGAGMIRAGPGARLSR